MQQSSDDLIFKMRSNQLKLELKEGSVFELIQEFIELFTKSAMLKNIFCKIKHRSKKSVALCCNDSSCIFKVNACFTLREQVYRVTKMIPIHTCSRSKMGNHFKPIIKSAIKNSTNCNIIPRDIINTVDHKFNANVKYITAYKAIQKYKCRKGIILNNSYSYIRGLIASFNPSLISSSLELEQERFTRYLWHGKVPRNFIH